MRTRSFRKVWVPCAVLMSVATSVFGEDTEWFTAESRNCGEVYGNTQEVANSVAEVCRMLPRSWDVVQAFALGDQLWMHISSHTANRIWRETETADDMDHLLADWERIIGSTRGAVTVGSGLHARRSRLFGDTSQSQTVPKQSTGG